MKKLFLLIFIFISIFADAQKLENVSILQNEGELIITYDLTSSKDELFKVDLLYRTNKSDWKLTKYVHGEIGDSITPGKNKKIMLWTDYLKVPDNTKVNFKLIAIHYAIEQTKKGTLKDAKNNTYQWIRYDDTRWMITNLKTPINGASNTENINEQGYLYTANLAHNACPEEWELPSDVDWKKLESHLGMDNTQVKEFGLRKVNLNNFIESGFNLKPIKYKHSLYENEDILAFWSSTHNQNYYWNSDKFFARIIKVNKNEISKKLLPKTNELSIRCIQSAIYRDTIEYLTDHVLLKNSFSGSFKNPFTGEKYFWQQYGNKVWLKKNIIGNYGFGQIQSKCPYGWNTPNKKDWENLFTYFTPSIKFADKNQIISQRMSAKGSWGFNMSNSDYWMDINYYTYKTYWINKDNKEDSKKLFSFPSNKSKTVNWNKKQTNEKAKLRYVLTNDNFTKNVKNIETGKFIDKRDNKEYKWVKIGNVKWMTENLQYIPENEIKYKNDNPANCKVFGNMYNFKTAETICPEGWRLPTSDEWNNLLLEISNNTKPTNYDLDKLYPFGETGFDLLLGGETITNGKNTIYTSNFWYLDNDEPGYFNFKSNGVITKQNSVSKKRDYIYIRCVKK